MQRYDYPVQITAFSADIVDTFTCTDFEGDYKGCCPKASRLADVIIS